MAWALISNLASKSATGNGFTSSSIDTSGANLIVVYVASQQAVAAPVLTDSKSNTWTSLTVRSSAGFARGQLFYCVNPTVGTGHTFTLTQTGSLCSLCVEAWSGSNSSPFDVENGASTSGAATLATGSITPNVNGELLITGFTHVALVSVTINLGFTISDQQILTGGVAYGSAMAYLVQNTAAAINPTWTSGGTTARVAAIAGFKVSTSSIIPIVMHFYQMA